VDEEPEEMHCMGSMKCKAKGGNVKGRKSRAAQRKERFIFNFTARVSRALDDYFSGKT